MTIERMSRWVTAGGMALGFLWLLTVVLAPPYLVDTRYNQSTACAKLEGCKTLTIAPTYWPDQRKLAWVAHVTATRALDKEVAYQTILTDVQDNYLLMLFARDVKVLIERPKGAEDRSHVRPRIQRAN